MVIPKPQLNPPNQIEAIRRIRGMSRKTLTQLIGQKSVSSVGHWETGRKEPSLRNAIKLALILKARIDQIFPQLVWEMKEKLFGKPSP